MLTAAKRVRVILVAAFMMSAGANALLVIILPIHAATVPAATIENVRSLCYTIAAAGIVTSLYWALTKLSRESDSARFLTDTIIAAALAEVCSVAGLVLYLVVQKRAEFWPFAIASLMVQGLFILPRALQHD